MKIELNKISTTKDSEIDLFKNMSSILSARYNVTFVGVTHQQYVSFHSNNINQIATREISDLWIISFSPSSQKARMTFLQAKYHRANLNQQHRTFSGDYFQYELLSQRPTLTTIVGQKFNFPLDILSFSCCGSIGSYGVFFIDNNDQINLAYCSAEYLTTNSILPTAYGQYLIDLDIPCYPQYLTSSCACNSCTELVSCFDIDTFINSILALEIGAELTFYPNILSFVRNIIQQNNNSLTTNQFINFSNNFTTVGNTNDNDTKFDGLPTNILIINSDEKISR